jgi:tetratricopeptide (TPR) repeat protein/CHAT domain-containing protein
MKKAGLFIAGLAVSLGFMPAEINSTSAEAHDAGNSITTKCWKEARELWWKTVKDLLAENIDKPKAAEIFAGIIKTCPESPFGFDGLWRVTEKEEQKRNMTEACSTAEKFRNDADGLFILGRCSHLTGNVEKAPGYFQEALKINPNHSGALNNLGLFYMEQKDFSAALQLFEKIIEVEPGFMLGWRNKKNALLEMKKNLEAQEFSEKAAERFPKTFGFDVAQGYMAEALEKALAKDYHTATSFINKAGIICEKIGSDICWGNFWQIKGRVQFFLGNINGAEDILRKSIPFYNKSDYQIGLGAVWSGLGEIRLTKGDMVNAEEMFSKALSCYKQADSQSGQGNILWRIGDVYLKKGNKADAEHIYHQALTFFEKTGDLVSQGNVWQKIAKIRSEAGDNIGAEEKYIMALSFFEKAGDLMDAGNVLKYLGEILLLRGDNKEAEVKLLKSLDLFLKTGDQYNQGIVWHRIGEIRRATGDNNEAEVCYKKAQTFFEKTHFSKGLGDVWMSRSQIQAFIGEYAKARENCRTALSFYEKDNSLKGLANAWLCLGQYKKALSYFEKMGDLLGQGHCWDEIGRGRFWASDNLGAEESFNKALGFFAKAGEPRGQGTMYLQLGMLKSSDTEALTFYLKAVQLFEAAHDFSDAVSAYSMIVHVLERSGRITEALNYSIKSVPMAQYIIEHAGSDENSQKVREMHVDVFNQPTRLIYQLINNGKGSLKDDGVRAYQMASQGRALLLLRRLKDQGADLASGQIPEELVKEERRVIDGVRIAEKAAAGKKEGPELEAVEKARKNYDRFVSSLRNVPQYRTYAALKYPENIDPSKLPLQYYDILVEFYVQEKAVYRFVLVSGSLELFDKIDIPEAELQKLVSTVVSAMNPLMRDKGDVPRVGDRYWRPYLKASAELHDRLLGDVLRKYPEAKRLILIPDGVLYQLPFELLAADAEKTDFLGLKMAVAYTPSAYFLKLKAEAEKVEKEKYTLDVLAIGDPVYDMTADARCSEEARKCMHDKDKDLKAARKECLPLSAKIGEVERREGERRLKIRKEQKLALKGYGALDRLCESRQVIDGVVKSVGGKSENLLGLEATRRNVLSAIRDKRPRVLLFDTHGVLPDGRGCGEGKKDCVIDPSLVLTQAEDGQYLTMKDIFEQRLSADLAVLSACQSGVGRIVNGEGVSGMGQAFLYAGARTVMMSLWSVAERTTSELMMGYFKALKEGKDRPGAMLKARQAVAGENPHPFFWAPFVLYGATE